MKRAVDVEAIRARSESHVQGSEGWLKSRYDVLTASSVAVALGMKGKSARDGLIREKVTYESTFHGSRATEWGKRYEPLINMIYGLRRGVEVYDLGLIRHKWCSFLGASSDGLTSDGINIEIKAPPSRKIDGEIPLEYWNQMQTQMEVLDIDMTHFIEMTFEEWDIGGARGEGHEEFWTRSHPLEWGVWHEYCSVDGSGLKYTYHILHAADEGLAIPAKEGMGEGWIYVRSMGWSLERDLIQRVRREPDWFVSVYPFLRDFWQEVEHGRKEGLAPKEPSTRGRGRGGGRGRGARPVAKWG